MAFGGLSKAVEEIRLDDSEDSPVFVIDFTDSAIMSKQKLINSLRDDMAELNRRASDDECDVGKLQKDLAVCLGSIISAFLGKKGYKAAVEYVSGGRDIPKSELNVVISPLAVYLLDRYAQVALPAGIRDAARKYLDEEPAAL